jgi:hypothetical protein
MVDGWVDSFGKVLHASKGKRQSSMDFISTIEISLNLRSTTHI